MIKSQFIDYYKTEFGSIRKINFVCVLLFVYLLAPNGIHQILYVHLIILYVQHIDLKWGARMYKTRTDIQILLILRKMSCVS